MGTLKPWHKFRAISNGFELNALCCNLFQETGMMGKAISKKKQKKTNKKYHHVYFQNFLKFNRVLLPWGQILINRKRIIASVTLAKTTVWQTSGKVMLAVILKYV